MKKTLLLLFITTLVSVTYADFNWDDTNMYRDNNTLILEYKEKQLNLTPIAQIAGEIYVLGPYLDCFRIREVNGWTYGCNVTIPDSPQGQFIADNLQALGFNISSNVDLRKVRDRLGIDFFIDKRKTSQFGYTETRMIFEFDSIINKGHNLTPELIIYSPYNVVLYFDVRNIQFHRGQVIDILDPTISLGNFGSTPSILVNITQEANANVMGISHITIADLDFINSSNVVLYMPFDVDIQSSGGITA